MIIFNNRSWVPVMSRVSDQRCVRSPVVVALNNNHLDANVHLLLTPLYYLKTFEFE